MYYGEGIYAIYKILGEAKVTKFIERTCEDKKDGKALWDELLKFLEKDIKVQLEKSMIYRVFPERKSNSEKDKEVKKYDTKSNLADNQAKGDGNANSADNQAKGGGNHSSPQQQQQQQPQNLSKKPIADCVLCGLADHVATRGPYGKMFVQYFSCKTFAESSPAERFQQLKKKNLCVQCLFPGALASSGKHVDGKCQSTYACKHDSHASFTIKKHILVCEEHKETDENKALLEEYRRRCITRRCNDALPDFAKTIH